MKKVIVTANAAGEVVIPGKTEGWGYIRVTQIRMVVDENGFAKPKEFSALIKGKLTDLKKFGYVAGQEIDGKVIWKESMKAFNHANPARDYKKAGETGIVCSVNGNPIYRQNFFTTDAEASDVSIEHDNGDVIKAAYAEAKAAGLDKI